MKAYVLTQGNAQGYLLLAKAQWEKGDAAACLDALDKSLALAPTNPTANLFKANLLLRTTPPDDVARLAVVPSCLAAVQQTLTPDDADGRYALQDAYAIYYALTGQLDKAQEMALKTLNEDRRETQAREILAALAP